MPLSTLYSCWDSPCNHRKMNILEGVQMIAMCEQTVAPAFFVAFFENPLAFFQCEARQVKVNMRITDLRRISRFFFFSGFFKKHSFEEDKSSRTFYSACVLNWFPEVDLIWGKTARTNSRRFFAFPAYKIIWIFPATEISNRDIPHALYLLNPTCTGIKKGQKASSLFADEIQKPLKNFTSAIKLWGQVKKTKGNLNNSELFFILQLPFHSFELVIRFCVFVWQGNLSDTGIFCSF